ncbi:MAG: alpha/beta hydrolase [Spirochaetota bacterium]
MVSVIILIIIIVVLLITAIFYIINETNFLYYEPQEYIEPDLSKLMHKDAGPIYNIKNNENAIMFVHGFTGNPKQLKYFSELAVKQGFDVITPLQPGAGTSKEDFKKTYFSQWYKYIKDKYLKYRMNYKNFIVAGLSMGGALTLKLAEEFANKEESPTAIITISAPVFLNSLIENGVLYNPSLYVTRIASWFVDEIKERFEKYTVDGADRAISYDGSFPKQIHSLKMALKGIKKNLGKITIPIMLAHSKGDLTVPFENLPYIIKNIASDKIKAKVYDLRGINHSHHVLPIYDTTRDDLFNEMKFFINQVIL